MALNEFVIDLLVLLMANEAEAAQPNISFQFFSLALK